MSSSAQELEREVEASRAGVEHTIDALRDRLSVGQMVDEGMKYFRESGGGELTHRLGEQVRSNPLPLVLVGVGLAWLMSGRGQPHLHDSNSGQGGRYASGGGGEGRGYGYNSYPEDNAEGGYSGRGEFESPSSGADRTYSSGGSSFDTGSNGSDAEGLGLADRAGAAAGWASDRVGSLGHAGKDAFARARQSSNEAYHDTTNYAGKAYSSLQRNVSHMLEREPLILGAIGLAVGAAIGAALPGTEVEDRLMGERSEQVKDEAKHVAEEQLDRAKDTAQKVYKAARAEAGSEQST